MKSRILVACLVAAALPAAAQASAIIGNGTIGLGVDDAGQLNIPGPESFQGVGYYGLRHLATNYEATADGCLCEGWGAAVVGGSTVYANNDTGSSYNLVSFTSTATTAVSIVESADGALRVTHSYSPSSSQFLYQVDVTIENISGTDFSGDTLYRRTMDWDIEPTAFSEYSTIQGTAGATNVLNANDNGFCDSNAQVACSAILASGDFVDSGPDDHGANFDFSFDALAAGESQTLTVFYGGAGSEALALGALSSVGAEVYSFGQSANDISGGTDITFIFGFKGVGGVVVPPPVLPEPGTWAMMIMGFGAIGVTLRRRARFQLA